MVKLRLMVMGKKHYRTFRLVAIHDREKRNSKALEVLGWYDPHIKDRQNYKIDADRVKYWLGVGAQPSDTVVNLLVRDGILPKPKHRKVFAIKPGKKASERNVQPAEAPAKEEAPAEQESTEEQDGETEAVAEATTEETAAAE